MPETNSEDRALPDMPETVLTCAEVEAQDLEARYLAGRLSPGEAEAYEAHYFGCERCWTALRLATEARAAFAVPRVARRGFRWARWALPAAAALAAVGVWQLVVRDQSPTAAFRGDTYSLTVTAVARADSVRATWPRLAGADVYRVRAFTPDGVLRWERETADTTLAGPFGGELLLHVAALDPLRAVVAQSRLVRVTP